MMVERSKQINDQAISDESIRKKLQS